MSIIITPPAAPAVPMALVRDHLRLGDDDAELALVGQYLAAATAAVEHYIQQPLIERTVEHIFYGWPLIFKFGPFIEVVQITYLDADKVSQTLAASEYRSVPECGVIAPVTAWPEIADREDAIRVQLKVGLGADWNSIPDDIRSAILLMTSQLHEYREPVISGSVGEVPFTYRALLDPHRRYVGI